ncbi:MAG TPA: hypothetical protein VHZ77_07550 [Gaiellaceae bacterium]|nr:hypothetical protein [Gaiellaceae bacterium]
MSSLDERAARRQQVDDLLRRIDVMRRRRLVLEAAGANAPGLERAVEQTRQELAELVR